MKKNNIIIICLVLCISTSLFSDEIKFKGLTYQVITSPITKQKWLDRNLGATEKCESLTNKKCFGDYYQWGRQANGHEKYNSKTTQKKLLTDSVHHTKFIRVKTTGNFDWRLSKDNTLWRKSSSYNRICPIGFKVPTIDELTSEIKNNKSFLMIPLSGYKSFCNGKLVQTNKQGALWSSSTYENDAYYLDVNSNRIEYSTSSRADAFPVRCIKE